MDYSTILPVLSWLKDPIVNIVFWLSIAVAFLVLIDFVLPKSSKSWIQERADAIWIWLDDWKPQAYFHLLFNKYFQLFGLILGFAEFTAILSWYKPAMPDTMYQYPIIASFLRNYYYIWVAIIAFTSIYISFRFIVPVFVGYVYRPGRNLLTMIRYVIAFGIAVAFMILGVLIIVLLSMLIGLPFRWLGTQQPDYILLGVFIISAVFVYLSSMLYFSIITLAMLSLFWFGLISLTTGAWLVMNFVLLRILESNKGAIIGLSGFLGGVSGLLKALI